ncbi:nucleotidyltransferase domain-containing protein [Streptomyces sp. A7024]|uniref:Nucleotidyltransferase domain-containing protein n=1 Tax=Streptomyces coryli TaxID=1128680 RepID=A0A6G4U748_9ACTN|nr:nucleotidyltransferase domain-containing protein [Streptomyces coryli]NGN67560.1 nucleotidyltransferase domain-containing protein [Streptomyces coryli]
MSRGLDADGYIAREGSLDRVPPSFAGAVVALQRQLPATGLHSAYLYGSVPRGNAVPGESDLDALLALDHAPTDEDRAWAKAAERRIDAAFPQVNGVGILLESAEVLLSELERHDMGWFIACLCTPLEGPDLAEQLPRYRPDSLLARETNGDLAPALPRWRERLASDADLLPLARGASRKLVRTGFTLVMPRWGGWTSDLDESVEAFAAYYPEHAEQLRAAARLGREPVADRALLTELIDDFGPWLAAEYEKEHGTKAPRPD